MPRFALLAALAAGLAFAVPSAAGVSGAKIVFFVGNADYSTGMFTVNPDGTGLNRLRSSGTFPVPSPDGSQVAFNEGGEIHVMNADGTDEHFVANGSVSPGLTRQPWSPDGSRIAFIGWNGPDPDVYVVSAAGGTPVRLSFDGRYKESPSWSPTGSLLVYSSLVRVAATSYRELFVVDANGGTPVQITDGRSAQAGSELPTWSPDGRSIAFIRTVRNQPSLYTVHPDGTELHRVADAEGNVFDRPAWSPDGTTIAFSTARNTGHQYYKQGREIFSVAADGSHEKRLTELAPYLTADHAPTWSPDGAQILFARSELDSNNSKGVMTMNADGTCEGPLAPGDGFASWLSGPGGVVGLKRCRAISVEGEVAAPPNHSWVWITATVTNEGTEPLRNVELTITSRRNDLSLSALSRECGGTAGRIVCRYSDIERGGSATAELQGSARTVTIGVPLGGRLRVTADGTLLETRRETDDVQFTPTGCTQRDPGRGRIDGTRYADQICGRRGPDAIHPGAGSDIVQAGDGNDVIYARDGRRFRDQISCGRGRVIVIADYRDRVSRDCEVVLRR